MQKLLRLLMLLSGSRRYTVAQLAERFEVAQRTIYRYLEAIEAAGFVLNRIDGACNLQLENACGQSLQKLLHFSEEEAMILYRTLSMIEGTSQAKERLIRKMHALYDLQVLKQMPDKSSLETIQKLREAVNGKRQVVLNEYRSSHSETITDRTVEAFDFLPDYTAIWCYDTGDNTCKQFKIARIKSVQVLPGGWQHEQRHSIPFTDAFHMSAPAPVATVEAVLNLKAYNLLVEEYPLTEPYLMAVNGKFALKIPVADYNGIARFALGLPGDIKITAPAALIDFLKKQREKNFTIDSI